MKLIKPLTDETKRYYLQGLNDALKLHPFYHKGMSFYDMELNDSQLLFYVQPQGIGSDKKALKAFEDMANILTAKGHILGFDIVDH